MAIIQNLEAFVQSYPAGLDSVTDLQLSQNENGRQIRFTIGGVTIPAGSVATISGTKPDGVVYSNTGTIEGSDTVIFDEDVQMTAVFGTWYAKIRITNAGNTIASARVRFIIDKDPVDAGAIPSESQLNGLVAEAEEYAGAAEDAAERAAITYGSPLTAATASAMTDINRVYVYTGSESGYTYGNWYYYNGSAWVSGGVYNSAAVETDITLTESGVPADAKATGDKIAELKDDLSDITDVMHISPNLLNLDSNTQANSYIKHDGTIGTENNWTAYTDYIPVEANTSYTIVYWNGSQWNQNTSAWYAFYDASYTATSGAILSQAYPANAGNNDAFIRVSFSNTIKAGKPMLIKLSDVDKIGSTLDSYMSVGAVVIDGLVVDSSDIYDFLTPTIVLPSKCRAVVGSQFNIYTENVLVGNNLENYTYFWTVRPYTMTYDIYSDCLRFTPTVDNIGTYTVTLEIKRKTDFVTVASKSMTLEVVANTARTDKSVVFIGDSLTNAGIYAYEIQAVLSNDGVESVGTITSTPWIGSVQMPINTEGRGGWSIDDYMTKSEKNGVSNAFWNPSTNKFDFSYWLTNNNFQLPDIVFINLGTNGAEYYDTNINGINDMIDSIRAVSDTVPICISLITPPATQDGWTYANHGGSAVQFKVFEMTLNSRIIAEFDNREDEYIYLSPVYFNLDRYHDYNTADFAVSARNPEVVTLQTNNVHPSRYGYLKFADVYWAMIQHLLG